MRDLREGNASHFGCAIAEAVDACFRRCDGFCLFLYCLLFGNCGLIRMVARIQRGGEIASDNVIGFSQPAHAAVFEPEASGAERFHIGGVVRDEQHGYSRRTHFVDAPHATLAEGNIADSQGLIDNQNARIKMCHNGEGQAQHHARRIGAGSAGR